MKVGYRELREFVGDKEATRMLNLAHLTLGCKSYPIRHPERFEPMNRFDVNEAIIKLEDKIQSTKGMDVRNKASREKHLETLLNIKDSF